MRGYMTISDDDKNSILQQHSSFYNGYSVGNVPSGPQPLRQDNGPSDINGITINNRGEVGNYRNHLVNESEDKIDFPPTFGDEREDYSNMLKDTDTEIDFPPTFGDEPEDFSYSDESYSMDIDSIMSMFDGSLNTDDTLPTYEFDSEEDMDIDLYEEEQCEGCGNEMYEEKEMCNECGGEMYEGECMECGGMYEEMDDDLKESFKKEKERISEMFDRFKKFN